MIDLYISKDIYDNCAENTDLYLLLHNHATQVWLDIDASELDEHIDSRDNDKPSYDQSQDNPTPKSGKIMLDCMREGKTIKHGLSKAIVILDDITEDVAKKISQQYGILCFTKDKVPGLLKRLQIKSKSYTTNKGWEFHFAPFKKKQVPCNVLVFIDRYLGTNDKFCNNFKNIMSQNITNAPTSISFHILIISLHNKKGEWYTNIKESCRELSSGKNCEFLLESLIFNEDDPLYKTTHNRHIFSNYWSLDAPHMIDAYHYNKEIVIDRSNTLQSIQVQGIFADGFVNNEYIQSVEDAQNTVLETLANDFKGGFTSLDEETKIGNNRRIYRGYRIKKDSIEKINKNNQINLLNRLIMDKISLKNGEFCSYLSLPYCNDWKNITIIHGEFKENGEYDNCIVVKATEKKTLTSMIKNIKDLFTDNKNYPQVDSEDGHYYRIVTTYPSDLKTMHVISSKQCEKPCNQCEGNCFKNVSDAMKKCNEIAKVLGIEEKYSDDMIEKVKGITSRGFLFLPYIPDKFNDMDKRILIIGASHNCPHSKDCPYFCDCTSCDIFMGNSKLYNNICPHKEIGDDNQELPLEETTKYTVSAFSKYPNEEINVSFYKFTDFMKKYFKEKNDALYRDFWNHVAFVNYAQNFESQKRGNHFSDEDFEAFKQYMKEIKPNVVIVWGSDLGNELRRKGIKPNADDDNLKNSNDYYWKGTDDFKGVQFVNCYHPSYNNLEDNDNFSKALDKIFNNKDTNSQ